MSNYQIIEDDCRQGLAQLATGSVQTCISSPPYWNLRDYGVAGQIGLEPLPDCLAWARQEPPCGGCFVCSMRSVYGAELRRVLADDGTVWVNLGDSYAHATANSDSFRRDKADVGSGHGNQCGLPVRNLIGVPWRVALALQADGWVLRQDIIWHKPNPMPESVKSRCTKAHEYIFLLSKKPRYYFNAEAIQEEATNRYPGSKSPIKALPGEREGENHNLRGSLHLIEPAENRNKRDVWTVASAPYAGAHFATYPPELIRPAVLAGSRPGDLVLDLFNGSGTTGQVALEEGRRYVGIELNPDYITLTHKRLSKVQTRLQFAAA